MGSSRKLYCVDLFAGCGGLSLGLEQAGFEPLAYCELSKDASASYIANREHLKNLTAFSDVASMTPSVLSGLQRRWRKELGIERVDLVCGGPPCQGYSGIGHRRSYAVERKSIPSNHLYREMIRIINQLQPRVFLFENVRGLMSGRWTARGTKGEIWRDVLTAFQAITGYTVRHALLQAKDYGVPQNRPRVIIVGIRDDEAWTSSIGRVADGLLPEASGRAPSLRDLLSDLIDPKYPATDKTATYIADPRNPIQAALRTLRSGKVLEKGDALDEQLYSNHSEKVRAKFRAMHELAGEIPEEHRTKKFAQRLLRPTWGPDGPNITATSLPDDFVHYKQPRTLTVREWARLQMFPDWYVFRGPRTTGGTRRAGVPTEGVWARDVPRYTQIGNAVPVELARKIGQHITDILRTTRRR